jgi:hypothetical protein
MYLNNLDQLYDIFAKTHFIIFVSPVLPHLKQTHLIAEPEKSTYSVEEIRKIQDLTRAKRLSALTIQINGADRMNEAAQNAFLKLLEEPGDNVTFLLHVVEISKILPTIKSRAQIYYHRVSPPEPNARTVALAKSLITADGPALIKLSADLVKDREKALATVSVAISIVTSVHRKNPSPKFALKLEKLLVLYENLAANGHIRLQILATML